MKTSKAIVLVFESTQKVKSDLMYFQTLLNTYFAEEIRTIKIENVFLNGKGNYKNPKHLRKIVEKQKQYEFTQVVFIMDTDDIFTNPTQKKDFETRIDFLSSQSFHLIWNCVDIESVYLNTSVSAKDKHQTAIRYYKAFNQNKIKLNKSTFLSKHITPNKSNALLILEDVFKSLK